MGEKETQQILSKITIFFIDSIPSGSFNGIAADRLIESGIEEADIEPALRHLLEECLINCTFSNYDGNIHIKRLPSLSIDKQLKLLEQNDLHEVGCYSTRSNSMT